MGLAPGFRRRRAHRGGMGAVYEIELLEESAEAFLFGERGRFAPKGVAGGGEGAVNAFAFETEEGWDSPPLISKMRGIQLKKGQAVRLETPGGGGYGAPDGRAPEAIAKDVASGLLSAAEADRLYGDAWKGAGA